MGTQGEKGKRKKRPRRRPACGLVESAAGFLACRVLSKAKADRVGTAIADVSVCGAVPPYNEVLGGKLVAMLMASPGVTAEYRRRYGPTPSVIASSMAGRSVRRPADLVFVGTTSLYGRRPCQYDRIRFDWQDASVQNASPQRKQGAGPQPLLALRAREDASIRYVYLGRTAGIGTFQFGKRTVEALKTVLAHSKRGQQVNCVFGEGVNPRLRQIRAGLSELGLDADELLRHGSPRLVYGVSLVRNLFEYLVGLEKTPRYLLPQGLASSRRRPAVARAAGSETRAEHERQASGRGESLTFTIEPTRRATGQVSRFRPERGQKGKTVRIRCGAAAVIGQVPEHKPL